MHSLIYYFNIWKIFWNICPIVTLKESNMSLRDHIHSIPISHVSHTLLFSQTWSKYFTSAQIKIFTFLSCCASYTVLSIRCILVHTNSKLIRCLSYYILLWPTLSPLPSSYLQSLVTSTMKYPVSYQAYCSKHLSGIISRWFSQHQKLKDWKIYKIFADDTSQGYNKFLRKSFMVVCVW